MIKRYLVGYCRNCHKNTKQEIIRCGEPFAERLFLGLITLGISEIAGHTYQCECTKCGEANNIDT